MSQIKLPLGKSWVQGRSYAAQNMGLMNFYPEIPSGGNRSEVVLLPTPGSIEIEDLGVSGTEPRIFGASIDYSQTPDTMFIVAGDYSTAPTLYEVDFLAAESVTVSNRGTLTNMSGEYEIMIETDPTYSVIFETVTGVAYVWDKFALTLTQITDADYPPNRATPIALDTMTYLDGYWIVTERNGGRFYISNLSDPFNWTATDFATAEQSSDPILRAFAIRNELWLFGKNSIEVWQNVGNTDFPFEPIPNVVFDVGLAAPLSIQSIGGSLVFISMDKSGHSKIMKADGFQLSVISTQEVEYRINNETNTLVGINSISTYGRNIYANSYTQGGHSFYMVTIPIVLQARSEDYPASFGSIQNTGPTDTSGVPLLFTNTGSTFGYDLSSGLWHQRSGLDGTFLGGDPSTEFPTTYYFRFLLHANGSIYGMGGGTSVDSDVEDKLYRIVLSDYVDLYESTNPTYHPVIRSFITPYYSDNRGRVFWHSVEIDVELFSLDNRADIDETMYIDLYYSDNGGVTWSYVGRRTPQAETATPSTAVISRLKWNRLGESRDRIYCAMLRTDKRCVILGMYADISTERSG